MLRKLATFRAIIIIVFKRNKYAKKLTKTHGIKKREFKKKIKMASSIFVDKNSLRVITSPMMIITETRGQLTLRHRNLLIMLR